MIESKFPENLLPSVTQDFQAIYDISLVIPMHNEAGNIESLLLCIHQAMKGIAIEVVFVDDSTDNTPYVIHKLQQWFPLPIKLIHRTKEMRSNGLGGAVMEGFKAAQAKWVCVMDTDLQHAPEMVPQLLQQANKTGADIVMGSRLAPGGDASRLSFTRTIISYVFAWATRLSFPQQLRNVTDPLTGFFMIRRATVDPEELKPQGFNILLEILVSHPHLKVAEVPVQFCHNAGESKASVSETVKFFRGLFRLYVAGSENFINSLLVGASGLFVNGLALWAFTEVTALHYLLSAILATQASTLWNFGWTEMWISGKRATDRSFVTRLVSSVLRNNAILLLRGPILALLVSQLGMHYIIANLASLFAMPVLRRLLGDMWIWNKRKQQRTIPMQPMKVEREAAMNTTETFDYFYNIHNIIKVASMYELPDLEYFRIPALAAEPDIVLRLERRHKKDRRRADRTSGTPRRSTDNIHYGESFGRYGFEVSISNKARVNIAVSPILRFSRHVLYTNVVEPILRWSFVRKGYALIHAACVSFDGQAVLVTAQNDTGKTSTILRTVDKYACSFLSSDMTILSRDGRVMSYPKPLALSHHTLGAVKANSSLTWWERIALQLQSRLYSRSGRKVGLNLSKNKLPAATMNAIIQMIVPPPRYMVHRLIPKATYANFATLSRAVIIERGDEYVEAIQHQQAVETFVRNAEDAYAFPPYPTLANSLSQWNGQDLHSREQAIVDEALKTIPTIRLRDPRFNWWKRLPLVTNLSMGPRQFAAADD